VSDVRVAVAGLGYWGPNLARNLASIPGCELAWLCDASDQALERMGAMFPAPA
jgi:predicted dehydrogenase